MRSTVGMLLVCAGIFHFFVGLTCLQHQFLFFDSRAAVRTGTSLVEQSLQHEGRVRPKKVLRTVLKALSCAGMNQAGTTWLRSMAWTGYRPYKVEELFVKTIKKPKPKRLVQLHAMWVCA